MKRVTCIPSSNTRPLIFKHFNKNKHFCSWFSYTGIINTSRVFFFKDLVNIYLLIQMKYSNHLTDKQQTHRTKRIRAHIWVTENRVCLFGERIKRAAAGCCVKLRLADALLCMLVPLILSGGELLRSGWRNKFCCCLHSEDYWAKGKRGKKENAQFYITAGWTKGCIRYLATHKGNPDVGHYTLTLL